ncbi:MAG: SLBB domain-containing protein [Candidatus Kapabacteria bacterium]|nr:SLBB domain-containing protein [Candidatus Kapabacteria bacterium]
MHFVFTTLLGGLIAATTYAQVAGFPPVTELSSVLSPQMQRQQQEALLRGEQTPADNVVRAQQYRVGPGDVLVIQRLDAAAQEEYAVVTPENMLVVPRIGMLSVGNMTLAQLRDTVIALYRQRNPTVPVYVGLRRVRTIYVTVQGNVLFPGVYTVPASMRLATLLRLAMQGNPQQRQEPELQRAIQRSFGQVSDLSRDEQILWQDYDILSPASLRSIVLRHADGTTTLVDGEYALLYPDSTTNPYLNEGDVVVVPRDERIEQPRLAIQGAVARPRTTVYRPGDRLSFLLKLGGALLPESGAIWLIQGGQKIPVQADAQLNLLSEDVPLLPGAVVVVERKRPELSGTGSVRIIGEVQRPGVYPIVPWATRLRDVIAEAGGFTERAALSLAYILRRDPDMQGSSLIPPNPYTERLRRLQYTNLLLEDTLRYFVDEVARRPVVACDFRACFEQGSQQDNVPLADGDVIVVPPSPRMVFVYGQVAKAGYVEYQPGKDAEYYIAQAGGRTDLADRGRERIIKGRTGVWMEPDATVPEPGDRIYVPHPPDEPLGAQLQRLSAYIGIAGGLSGLVFSIVSLVNFLRNR